MTNTVLLNNIDHQNLKVVTRYGPEYGDAANQAVVFPTEFEEVQREYPILFRKDSEGKFQAVALLGFDRQENLFLEDGMWNARHVPAIHQRGPFMIGFQDQKVDGEVRREPVVYVDLDDARVGETDGHPVFLPHGGSAPYLQHVSHLLRAIRIGEDLSDAMFVAFDAAGLIEPAALDVSLDQHTVYQIPEIFSINAEKLATLEGDVLGQLNRAGFLRLAYLVLASLSNVNRLIAMKNARRAVA
ncbi:MAG: SapC family protein [Hyphomonas sp.]|uniref:SapC family protein n=1 Tax=Hyphomonas sp. TaxID=87 RepID=UPI0035271984